MRIPLGPSHISASLTLLWVTACAGAPAQQDNAAVTPATQPTATAGPGSLNRFAAERVMVIPSQGVLAVDPLGWRAKAGTDKALLQRVDSALEAAFAERGLAQWIFAPALVRAAKRNPTYIADPYQVRAAGPVRLAMRTRERAILEPLSSQLRGLSGVSDTRWALVPLELGFAADGAAGGRVHLALAIIDVRSAQLRWTGEVLGDVAPDYAFAAVASAIQRAADLVVPK